MKTKDFRVLIFVVVPLAMGVLPLAINHAGSVEEKIPQETHTEIFFESETGKETDAAGQNHGGSGVIIDPELNKAPEEVPDEKSPCIVIYTGDETKNEIAFTFDDTGANFDKILATLKEKGINGTFFLLTSEIKNNPERWQQAVNDGNLVCSHGTSHNFSLGRKSEDEIRTDIQEWEDAVTEVLGADYLEQFKKETPYFRIPGGNKTEKLLKVLGEMGYKYSFYWTAEDCWSTMPEHNPKGTSLDRIYISRATSGAIFLLHPPHQKYVDEIIDGVLEKGYTFVTLDQWNDYYETQAKD